MTQDEAGRLQELWKAKYGDKPCSHGRMVDCLTADNQTQVGYWVCQECGAVFQDPFEKLSSN